MAQSSRKRPSGPRVERALGRAISASIAREVREVIGLWKLYGEHQDATTEIEIGRRLATLGDYLRMQSAERNVR